MLFLFFIKEKVISCVKSIIIFVNTLDLKLAVWYFTFSLVCTLRELPYVGNFSRREILAIGRCVKFSLSPNFAISRTLSEDVH